MLHTNTLRRSALAVLAATLSVGMVACGGGKTTPPVTNAVTAVTVSPAAVSVELNKTTTITANVTTTGTAAKTVTWSTSDATVATVNNGVVTGVKVGTAKIRATSTVNTSKFAETTVTVTAGTTTTLTTARIVFGTSATVAPTGYSLNTGATNWVTETTAGTASPTTLNMVNNTRNRSGTANLTGTTDARQLGQMNMQCGTATDGKNCAGSSTLTSGAFEFPVVNGKYNVTVSVGDASSDPTPDGTASTNQNSVHVINAEGVVVVPAFTPTGTTNATNFSVKTAAVTVTDGKLTIDAKGGKNTKINYIDIIPAP